jgi:PAS domain S-box-containing protein
MGNELKVLIVEDVATDAEIVARQLNRAGIICNTRLVDTAAAFVRQLEQFKPQVILSDFSMPHFEGMEALAIARQSYSDIPFIFVSGSIGEEHAIRALKNGATDYVLKSNLIRLPAAVEKAIQEAQGRQARQALEQELRESEKRYRALFDSNPHPMWVYDIETLCFLAVNDTAVARYGFSREEFLVMTIKDIRPEKERRRLQEHVAQPLPTVNKPETWQHRTKHGELVDVEIASHDLVLESRRARIVVAYDITERKRAEQRLMDSEAKYRQLI